MGFLQKNPWCAFCGGTTPATTIEHCPQRSMFEKNQWPEGFEFPACHKCNGGTSDQDLLVSMLARFDVSSASRNADGKLDGIMKLANRQYPGLFERMRPSANEARRMNREAGIQPKSGQTHQETNVTKIPPELHEAVGVFARKLSKAVYYLETEAIFPNCGCLLLNWFTNSELQLGGDFPVFERLKAIYGTMPSFQRSRSDLSDQFKYKVSISENSEHMILQARFGGAFGLVIMGCTLPTELEATMNILGQEIEKESPLIVLQSFATTNDVQFKRSYA
jgi:hypothetical protein